jgi:hypothetical protein
MCLLAVLYRVASDAPLIVAANREEAYDRPGTPPRLVADPVSFVAGLDTKAGGTWLGLSGKGLVVAVTNAAKSRLPAEPRSRGLLVRDLLQCGSVREAAEEAARAINSGRYAGCNIVCAGADGLAVIYGGDWLRVNPLPSGIYVLTHRNVNDGADRRVAHALAWLTSRSFGDSDGWLAALRELCSQGGGAGAPAICLHGEKGGTVSSSLIVLRSKLAESGYWHAQGPPDQTPYLDYSSLLTDLSMSGSRT